MASPIRIVVVHNDFPRLAAEIQQKADVVAGNTAQQILAHSQMLIQSGPKTGRVYATGAIKARLGKRERASARLVRRFGRLDMVTASGLTITASAKGTLSKIVGYKIHRASAPGEAPATDTGNLVNSGYAKRARRALWHVGYTAEYARPLEFGTPRILPRPFLRPAVDRFRQAFVDAMRQVLG